MDKLLTPIDLVRRPDFRVGKAHVSPATRAVVGPFGSTTLEPRVMQVLVALAESAGQVVTRETLAERCWGGVYIGDDVLNRAIAAVRRALREVGGGDAPVETIPRTGYRLLGVAPIAASNPSYDDKAANPASDDAYQGHFPTAHALVPAPDRRMLLAGAAASVAAGSWLWWSRSQKMPPDVQALIAQSDQAMRQAVPEHNRQGVGFLREAIALAPDHAEAWGKMALALRASAEFAPPSEMLAVKQQVQAAAQKALDLHPGQPDARTALALLGPLFGNWADTHRQLQAIVTDAPGHLPSLDGLAYVMAAAGLVEAHYPLRLKTVAEDPLHAGYNFRSIYAHWMNGNVAAADRAAERGMELWPRHFATWGARLDVLAYTGRPLRALALLDDSDARPSLPPKMETSLRTVYRALADGRSAERQAARTLTLSAVSNAGPYMAVAAVMDLSALGFPQDALDVAEGYLLERGPIITGTSWKPGQVLHNDVRRRMTHFLFLPVCEPIRKDPRFLAICEGIGLRQHWDAISMQPDFLRL